MAQADICTTIKDLLTPSRLYYRLHSFKVPKGPTVPAKKCTIGTIKKRPIGRSFSSTINKLQQKNGTQTSENVLLLFLEIFFEVINLRLSSPYSTLQSSYPFKFCSAVPSYYFFNEFLESFRFFWWYNKNHKFSVLATTT